MGSDWCCRCLPTVQCIVCGDAPATWIVDYADLGSWTNRLNQNCAGYSYADYCHCEDMQGGEQELPGGPTFGLPVPCAWYKGIFYEDCPDDFWGDIKDAMIEYQLSVNTYGAPAPGLWRYVAAAWLIVWGLPGTSRGIPCCRSGGFWATDWTNSNDCQHFIDPVTGRMPLILVGSYADFGHTPCCDGIILPGQIEAWPLPI